VGSVTDPYGRILGFLDRLKGHTVSNYENSPDTFNDHFLSIAEKIMQSIRHSGTEDTSENKNQTYYLSKISHNPFPNIKYNLIIHQLKKLKELSNL
jgi:hypothetical protein